MRTFNHTTSTHLIEFEEFVHLISSFVLKNEQKKQQRTNTRAPTHMYFFSKNNTNKSQTRKKSYISFTDFQREKKEPKITNTHTHMNNILYRDFKWIRKTTSRWYFSQNEREREIQVRFNVHFKCKEIYGNRARWRVRKTKINNIRAQTHTAKWKEITLSIKFIVNKSIEMINYYTYYFNVLSFNRRAKCGAVCMCVRMLLIFYYCCCCFFFCSYFKPFHKIAHLFSSPSQPHSVHHFVSPWISLIFHLCELWMCSMNIREYDAYLSNNNNWSIHIRT